MAQLNQPAASSARRRREKEAELRGGPGAFLDRKWEEKKKRRIRLRWTKSKGEEQLRTPRPNGERLKGLIWY